MIEPPDASASGPRGRHRDALLVVTAALVVRLAIVAWARSKFPAVEDGEYYDVLARRLAAGAGYTWAWPDGTVTYAAHYPVGYPALLAMAYRLFGVHAGAAMTVNALLGAAGAYAAYWVVADGNTAPWRPLAAGLMIAVHPALAPYAVAVMTEGVTASLLVVAAALAAQARTRDDRQMSGWPWAIGGGLVFGVATLVRPQSLLLAPVFGLLATRPEGSIVQRLGRATIVTAVALACVMPWTLRNCARMQQCALVSANGGWNLLIGAQTTTGAWEPLVVPAECDRVWDEVAKDACFGKVARRDVAAAPVRWLSAVPAKLAATFDYFGAAPWYLHASNPTAFGNRRKVQLGAVEIVSCRVLLLVAIVVCGRLEGRHALMRKIFALGGAIAALTVHAWPGYASVVACVAMLGPGAWVKAPFGVSSAAAVVAVTAAVHAAFFGAGRYGLVVTPFIGMLAFVPLRGHGSRSTMVAVDAARAIAGRASVRQEESPSSKEHNAG